MIAAPAVFLDECISQHVAAPLRARGIGVTTAADVGLLGAEDAVHLGFAASHELVLITHDHRDFRRLHAHYLREGRAHGGIVILPVSRSVHIPAIRAAMMIDWLAEIGDFRLQVFRWGDLQMRLTQGLRIPGYSENEIRLAVGLES